MRWLKRIAFTLITLAAIVAAGTLLPKPLFEQHQDEPRTRRILLLSNPIHTDIAVPIDAELLQQFGFLAADGLPVDLANAQYLVFGWGGRAFYLETPTWSELKPGPLLKGLTLDSAAMHVGLAGEIVASDMAIPLQVDEIHYRDMMNFIRSIFVDDASGKPIHINGSGYGDFDTFYEAKGPFTALLGCNTWTAASLRFAGVQTGYWNPLPVLLRWSLRLHNSGATMPEG